MKRLLAGLLIFVFLLSGCGSQKSDAEHAAAEANTGQVQTVTAEAADQPEVIIDNPEYVYLPDDEEPTDSMVFHAWTQDEDKPEKIVAQYQDLSDIENAIALASAYGEVGEIITLPLSVCGQVDLCAFDLRVTYDPVKLQYQGTENEDDDLIVNCDEESGRILINYLSAKNLSGRLNCCNLRFTVKETTACDTAVQVDVVQAVALGDDDEIVFCHFSTVDGIAHLNQERG